MWVKVAIAARKFRRPFLLPASVAASVAGVLGTFVPWGPDEGLHGKGFPIPSVMWDRASRYHGDVTTESDHLSDFVNPWAIFLNPILFLIGLALFWGVVEFVLWMLMKKEK